MSLDVLHMFFIKTSSLLLKEFKEGAVTTSAGSLSHCSTTRLLNKCWYLLQLKWSRLNLRPFYLSTFIFRDSRSSRVLINISQSIEDLVGLNKILFLIIVS